MDERDRTDAELDSLAREIRAADAVVALTGAGISAPSGVPTFRGDDGIWKRFEQGQFTYGRFQRDPGGFWRDRIELHEEMYDDRSIEPNDGHRALARLGSTGHLTSILTQNVDGLHTDAAREVGSDTPDAVERDDGTNGIATDAGSGAGPELIELHGNARRVICTDCGRTFPSDEVTSLVHTGECPPRCGCDGLLKPDVVLFGEALSPANLQQARTLAGTADVFLAIGSSLVVEPAASLPTQAAARDATVAVVNLEGTPVDRVASHVIRDDVTDVLPRLADAVEDD